MLSRRSVGALAPGLVLVPERYDPRRSALRGVPLASLVELPGETCTALTHPTVVLDTSHLVEGFVPRPPAPVEHLGSTKRLARPGDVLISRLRPYLRQVAWLDEGLGDRIVVSTELHVLRSTPAFDAAALVPWLLSAPVQAALAAAQEGGHHPRFPPAMLRELPVPDAVVADAPRLAAEVKAAAAELRRAVRRLDQLVAGLGP